MIVDWITKYGYNIFQLPDAFSRNFAGSVVAMTPRSVDLDASMHRRGRAVHR